MIVRISALRRRIAAPHWRWATLDLGCATPEPPPAKVDRPSLRDGFAPITLGCVDLRATVSAEDRKTEADEPEAQDKEKPADGFHQGHPIRPDIHRACQGDAQDEAQQAQCEHCFRQCR
jgi:hypothetical protein